MKAQVLPVRSHQCQMQGEPLCRGRPLESEPIHAPLCRCTSLGFSAVRRS